MVQSDSKIPERQTAVNTNGRVWPWVIGLVIPTLLSGTIGWVSAESGRVTQHGEQIAGLNVQMQYLKDELSRVNAKLDRLLEKDKQRQQ